MAASRALPAPVAKTHRRLLPLFISLVVVCYLDRTALAFAALQLCHTPWFNAKVYGLGSSFFYLSYVTCQVPSNLILSRLGARTWLPLITAAWGVVATCCIFISGPASFYVLRLALGMAESGAFPAMWAMCGQFYPSSHITVAYSVIEASIAISQIIAAPVAAGLLQLSGVWGLAGWQHLFLWQGCATIFLAGILFWRLPSSVLTADFLTAEDKMWLMQQLQPHTCATSVDALVLVDGAAGAAGDSSSQYMQPPHQLPGSKDVCASEGAAQPEEGLLPLKLLPPSSSNQQQQLQPQLSQKPLSARQQLLLTLRNRLIWYLMLLKALKDIALDGLVYWLPMLTHALIDGSTALGSHAASSGGGDADKHCGSKDSQLKAVLLTAIPFGTAAVAALALGHSSEVSGERRKHVGLPLALGGCCFSLLPLLLHLRSVVPAFLAVTAAVVAADATTGPFWTWVHLAAAPGTEAVSLAAVNSVGKAGGFLGPLSFGLILHATGSYVPSILLVSGVLVLGGVLALSYRGDRQQHNVAQQYSKLQEDPLAAAAASTRGHQGCGARGDVHHHRDQRQQQQPELELLRGSSEGSSYHSSSS